MRFPLVGVDVQGIFEGFDSGIGVAVEEEKFCGLNPFSRTSFGLLFGLRDFAC